jgi:hypothetical protein
MSGMTDNGMKGKTSNFDPLLTMRAQQASEMPWLELKVTSQIEWREQARQWLRQHPGGLAGRRPASLRQRLWQSVCGVSSSRNWHVAGVLLITIVMLIIAMRIPALASASKLASQWGGLLTVAAALCCLAAALASWPRLRQYYS